ncbi:hypothetical protein BZJ17_16880 [Salinivibrio sp. IB574]|uniref:hypothetical protein n=1 Tax=Salinivibrio sp. IB574 TaxID=1909444 RepID=UPI000988FE8F|nr:hypothetical protein [Salinivibrio sp. IB574]OOF17555.1 hypothetical protein BZJ17_16880 [Salinivibrio sp. IB574]
MRQTNQVSCEPVVGTTWTSQQEDCDISLYVEERLELDNESYLVTVVDARYKDDMMEPSEELTKSQWESLVASFDLSSNH